jgi:hypothetical protein
MDKRHVRDVIVVPLMVPDFVIERYGLCPRRYRRELLGDVRAERTKKAEKSVGSYRKCGVALLTCVQRVET